MAAPAIALALLASSAPAYEADKIIADVEEPPFHPSFVQLEAPAVGRVATEDLPMHCRDESGHWHRLHPNKLQTACGKPFTNWHAGNTRSGRYVDAPLAPAPECDCWTRDERQEAADRSRPVGCV